MKYSKAQLNKGFYHLWESGLLLPPPPIELAKTYSVKFQKSSADQYSRVTLSAANIDDALERACFAVTYSSGYQPEQVDLHAVYDFEDNLLWLDEFYLRIVQKKFEFRGMERREFLKAFGATSAAILFGLVPCRSMAGTTTVALSGVASGFSGEQVYASPGSYSWTAPTGASSVSVVCVGGGGGNPSSTSGNCYQGAGGGGLAWASGITVSVGSSYSVTVGTGGTNSVNGGASTAFGITAGGGSTGGLSPWNTVTSSCTSGVGGGGAGGTFSVGAVGTSRGGGNGGAGGAQGDSTYEPGGGGAGGYSGKGGDGGRSGYLPGYVGNCNGAGEIGTGGGGAGGYGGGGACGGGVGIYGAGATPTGSGAGGSGGTNGDTVNRVGGAYGGGGGGVGGSPNSGSTGGSGAVRIIWGSGRSFPNNAS